MRIVHIACSLFLAVCISLPTAVLAHGDRPSFEVKTGPYLIDIGYDNIGFRPGEEVVFDFDLYTETGDTIDFAPFTAINVTFEKDGQNILSEQLENEPTHIPTLGITFPEAGEYQLNVAYKQNDQEIATASFDVPVGNYNGIAGRFMNSFNYAVAAVLVLVALYAIVQSYRRRKTL